MEWMTMSPYEKSYWHGHFRKFPQGDFYTQLLLARLICMIYNRDKKEGIEDLSVGQAAPWLAELVGELTDENGVRLRKKKDIIADRAAILRDRAKGNQHGS